MPKTIEILAFSIRHLAFLIGTQAVLFQQPAKRPAYTAVTGPDIIAGLCRVRRAWLT
jgi:hypothetical protein